MWEDGACLGIKATLGDVIVENLNGVWLTRTVRRKTARERQTVVAVPWRKNEDDAKMDGERLQGEVVMMDKEMLEMEEHHLVPKRVYITCEDLKVFGSEMS